LNLCPTQTLRKSRRTQYAESRASEADFEPVMTNFPEVKSKIVQFGLSNRSVTAANFRRLKDEKRNI
jgi:hypothetical protein